MSICHESTQESKNVLVQVKESGASSSYAPAALAAGAQTVLAKYGALINQYCLIVPPSVAAVRIWIENRGNPKSYVAKTGEAGLLQLWPWAQTKYGVTNWADPAENLRGGFQMWRDMTNSFIATIKKNTGVQLSPTGDFWALGQLNTMIGSGATAALVKLYGPSFNAIYAGVHAADADAKMRAIRGSFGTQSAACVAHRIVVAAKMHTAAQQLGGLGGGLIVTALAGVGGYFLMRWYLRRR